MATALAFELQNPDICDLNEMLVERAKRLADASSEVEAARLVMMNDCRDILSQDIAMEG